VDFACQSIVVVRLAGHVLWEPFLDWLLWNTEFAIWLEEAEERRLLESRRGFAACQVGAAR
jgi:hypothetical protein